jgi:hypothetical protein
MPERATRSLLVLRPTAANLDLRAARLSEGAGMEELAPLLFAIKLSLLPKETVHEGPPACDQTLI